jgi:signal transduction histidine kinase
MEQAARSAAARVGATVVGREIGLAAFATLLTAAMWLAGWMDPLDRVAGDAALRWTNRHPGDVPVAVVAIDERSVASLGPLPWSRSIIARMITAAREAGATGVAVDLLLSEPSDATDDSELRAALDAGPSILAAALDHDGRWLLPLRRFGGFERAAHVHAEVGADGVARTIAATKQSDGLSLPAMSLSAARLVDPEIVIEPGGFLRPDFRPAPDRVLQIAAADLLAGHESPSPLAGRMVLVGVTATGSGDRLVVPTGPGTAPSPGVLVHASAAASILRGGLIHRQGPWWALLCVLVSATVPQLVRTRAGSLRPWSLVAMTTVIVVATLGALELGHVQTPAPAFVVAMVLSAALREGYESKLAQRESGLLLQSLLRHHRPGAETGVPRSAVARLAALRQLQAVVLEQDAARRTLLEGMRDGVLMWGADRRTRVVNPAAVRLWGSEPRHEDVAALTLDDDGSTVIDRRGRDVELSVFAVGDGGMALLRDVTAVRELERKRRDTQRLVSHELKTPLASIAGFGETLERYELDPDEQRRVAALIRAESHRLGEMVATFLDLERLGSDRETYSTEPVDLGGLVGQRLEILSEAARSRAQTITSELETGVVIRGSADLLARVVDNLVGNALKFSDVGSTVSVVVMREDGTATLAVSDHGPGIPEEVRHRLFERFFRVPGVEGTGSGLGLAVVDEIVTWHKGCMKLDSAVGRGSTFTVHLPAEE